MKKSFEYEIIYSRRKTVAIQVTSEGKVVVRAPYRCPRSFIEAFVRGKEDWVLKHLEQAQANLEKRRASAHPPLSAEERARYIMIARDIFTRKVEYYARISIREQKTRWGSCSSKGDLNFNWRLILAPEEVLDYVVVHELAHRREMNHSKAFYAIVESVLPDYRRAQKWLKDNGQSLWYTV